ncbi:MAG: Clp protease N-terminal domain-containing protein [Streptosporangiaceae bacterium]
MPGKTGSSAAAVLADAVQRARAEGTSQISEEHLFAALLGNPASQPLLGRLAGPGETEAVWAEVHQRRRRGGVTAAQQQALAGLGIDLDELVARVEAQLGEGALTDGPRLAGRRGWRTSMSADAVAALNAAQRQKAARGDRNLTAQHLVLGLLTGPGLVGDTLRSRGITVASALQVLDGGGPAAG